MERSCITGQPGRLCLTRPDRQGLSVMLDCCRLGQADSPFLQQAADMTGGCYLRPGPSSGLLQYLLVRL